VDQKNLAELYNLEPVPWSRALDALEEGDQQGNQTSFLTTVRPDGRPHVAGVGAVWDNGRVYFVSGPGTRKSRNVAENPSCVMAISLKGIDLVIEGDAERVTDDQTLQRLAKRYAEGGWPARVENGAFTYDYSAPSAGPPPWYVYAITPKTVYGVLAAEPGGAMRWRFDA
jgi:nitroimidazol reductase NimA-like FMN-containing flavoprotein (pyridoxamine 5'-phosphate oxidase superfamily)